MPAESAVSHQIDGPEQTQRVDVRVAELAGRQFGVVSREQLLELGLGRGAIEARLRAGRLIREHAGVYAVGHRVVSRAGHLMAAVLACGRGAVLSHRSAAALWGLRPKGAGPIEVTTPRKWRSSFEIHRHCSHLLPDEMTSLEGIPVTTVPRTILDLAAISRPQVIESLLREAEYLRLYDSLSLPVLLDRHCGRRGVRAVRAALARCAESPGRIRSRLEERFLPFLDRHGLPRPQFNAWLFVGEKSHQVDCLWRSRRVVVELDGWQGHRSRRAFQEDRARDRRLRVAGYSVTRIAWTQLDDEPEAIAADLRKLLSQI